MSLQTSLFSKALVKSDIKRYWWISVIYVILSALFICPDAVMNEAGYNYTNFRSDEGVFALIFSFILGGLLFSYLHRANSVSFMNSIPVSRTTQYFSHILSGFILLVVPIALTSIVILFEELYLGLGIHHCYRYFYICFLYSACAFMLTAFTSVISGNLIAVYIFGGSLIILPFFALTVTNEILYRNIYGFTDFNDRIMHYIYIIGISAMWSKRSVVYIAIAIALFVISLLLYKMRNMENYSEVVAFKPLKPILMYFMAICFGLFGYVILDALYSDINFTLGTLPLGIIALIAVFMLNRKSLSFKGVLKPIAIFTVLVGIVNLIFVFDLTGYEKRIPDESNIVSIDALDSILTLNYDVNYNIDTPNYDKVRYKGTVTDKKNIDTIVNLHKQIIQRGSIADTSNNPTYITIKYNLKNNKTLSRSYALSPEEMKNIYEIDNYKKVVYPIVNDNKKVMNYAQILDSRLINSGQRLNNIDLDKLAYAVKQDILALTPEELELINLGKSNQSTLDINYTEYAEYKGNTYKYNITQHIPLDKNFKNVLNYLQQQDYTSNYIPVDGINSLDIDYSIVSSSDTADDEDDFDISNTDTRNVQISNKDDIKAIMKALYNPNYQDPDDKSNDLYYISIFSNDLKNNGNDGYITVTLPADEISPALKKYFKK